MISLNNLIHYLFGYSWKHYRQIYLGNNVEMLYMIYNLLLRFSFCYIKHLFALVNYKIYSAINHLHLAASINLFLDNFDNLNLNK